MSNGIVELRQCLNCNHWWINPLPMQDYLNSLYANGSEFVVTGWQKRYLKPHGLKIVQKHVLKFEKNPKGLNYLEIGIGSGSLFNAFKKRGCTCTGVEPGVWGKEKDNIYYSIMDLPKNVKYDIIVATDVIEHIESPISMLQKLRELANPNGRIYCSFPNNNSLRAFYSKAQWRMVMPLGHLHYFSKKSLTKAFKATQWKITNLDKSDLFPHRINMENLKAFKRPIGLLPFLSPKTLSLLFVEVFNLGDQWFLRAEVN